ncbi:hypothetical protein JG688_00005220 [Phytophthora aleatoria]|uniref:Uncharacterized protein n=1 Tax=Phytophthora aleatoria TaxID=2496075 RepID=A0A8J5IMU5_9STRA|nr:hypothetical protein JG688_00005220 [Phytophthora aleatoria]
MRNLNSTEILVDTIILVMNCGTKLHRRKRDQNAQLTTMLTTRLYSHISVATTTLSGKE